MTSMEFQVLKATLERAGGVVLEPREADALRKILPMIGKDEIQFVFGRATAAFDAAVRLIG